MRGFCVANMSRQDEARKNSPKVTVLMPVYNGEKYLRESMESILSQTFEDFELLVIDDGSTDSSREIVSSYGDARIKLVENGDNLGVVESLNRGVQLARGKYIARMDCDDISFPERLDYQVKEFERNKGLGVCGSWTLEFQEDGRSYLKVYETENDKVKSEIIFNSPIAHSSAMFRRSLVEKLGVLYRSSLKDAEDYDLWVRASKVTGMSNIPRALLRYRIHTGQVSSKSSLSQVASADAVRKGLLSEMGLSPTEREHSIHRLLCHMDLIGFRKDMFQEVDRWLRSLKKANETTLVFPEPAFTVLLGEKWSRICYFSPFPKRVRAIAFLRSPFCKAGSGYVAKNLFERFLGRRQLEH